MEVVQQPLTLLSYNPLTFAARSVLAESSFGSAALGLHKPDNATADTPQAAVVARRIVEARQRDRISLTLTAIDASLDFIPSLKRVLFGRLLVRQDEQQVNTGPHARAGVPILTLWIAAPTTTYGERP